MPELNTLGLFTKAQMASVSSCFFITYGVGQFINGFLGDRIAPRQMVFGGLLVSSLCNLLLFFAHGYGVLLFFWGMNGFVQSMVWSPILRLAGEYYDEKGKSKFGIDISTTVPLGTLASYGVSMLALKFLPWNGVFLVCGLIVLAVSLVWFFGTGCCCRRWKGSRRRLPHRWRGQRGEAAAAAVPLALRILRADSAAHPIAVHGTLKDSVTQWVPTYIVETLRRTAAFPCCLR